VEADFENLEQEKKEKKEEKMRNLY